MNSPANLPVWDDGAWTPLRAITGTLTCDSCVVGLGGSGLTIIEELLSRGDDVVGLDAQDVGAGAAGRNGGFLLAGAYDYYHDAVRLHGRVRSLDIYGHTIEEIARIAEAVPQLVRFTGSRRLAATPQEVADCRLQMTAMRADGLSVEWYEGDAGIGLSFPADATFNPLARCRTLARRAMKGGARLYARSPVTSLTGTEVVTSGGRVHCRRVFVAIDGRLELLLPELAPRVRTARLQMLATAPTTERAFPCPMNFREGYEYWQQLPDGTIALGGFRDRGGESEWTHSTTPTDAVQHLLEEFLRESLQVHAPITHRWAASAAFSHNGLPVLDEVREGVWAIGAYSGTGNVIGALCGRAVVAKALDGDATLADLLTG